MEEDFIDDWDEESEEGQTKPKNETLQEIVDIETEGNDNGRHEKDKSDRYQIEKVNGDIVWACNFCDHGFDSNDKDKITHEKWTKEIYMWWLTLYFCSNIKQSKTLN